MSENKQTVDKDILKRDLPINIVAALALCLMIFDLKLSRIEGIILSIGIIAYIILMVISALKNREEGEEIKTCILRVFGGGSARSCPD